jgi:hypothetical protein
MEAQNAPLAPPAPQYWATVYTHLLLRLKMPHWAPPAPQYWGGVAVSSIDYGAKSPKICPLGHYAR